MTTHKFPEKHSSNLPGRVVYKTPRRLDELWPDKQKWENKEKPDKTDILKSQVEKVREIYRILRSELIDYESSADSSIIEASKLDGNITIEQHLLAEFPVEYSDVIRFACYIEENVNSFPENPIKPWVTVPKSLVWNLIGNALSKGMDRYEVYTILGTYLWSYLGDSTERDGIPGRFIQSYSITKLYDSIGVSAKKVNDIWRRIGILYEYDRSRPGGEYSVSSEVFIPDSNMIIKMTKAVPSFTIPKMRSDTKLELTTPKDMIPKMNGYFFHYPVDAKGIFNQQVPIIFSSEETITIPLVKNISPAVIAAVFTIPELAGLLNHLKANQRGKYIGTILKHTTESIERVNGFLLKFNRENHQIPLTPLDNRDTFHRIITGMSVSGVSVDKEVLNNLDLDTLIAMRGSRKNAEKEREKILKQISLTNGTLHSQYHLKSRTERVYTKYYNIQGLPKLFHEAIVPKSGHQFIYFDIVANDLSMLFNMIEDKQGLVMLRDSKDPYSEIAIEAFNDKSLRNQVKAFVSPFLYGASNETIIAQSKGQLDKNRITLLRAAMRSLFPESCTWLGQLRSSASKGLIPKEYNPIDRIDIPIPKDLGPTVGPAMIIQRYGARLFRAIIIALTNIGYHPKVFVHDSLLIEIRGSVNIDNAMYEIMESIDVIRFSKGLKALAIKIGSGKSWKAADDASIYKSLGD